MCRRVSLHTKRSCVQKVVSLNPLLSHLKNKFATSHYVIVSDFSIRKLFAVKPSRPDILVITRKIACRNDKLFRIRQMEWYLRNLWSINHILSTTKIERIKPHSLKNIPRAHLPDILVSAKSVRTGAVGLPAYPLRPEPDRIGLV